MVLNPSWSARQGLVTAGGVMLALLLALWLGLEDPWWAALSAWIVAHPDRHALWAKAVQRVIGTVLGLGAGLALAVASAGQPGLLALSLFVVGALGARGRFGAAHDYAWFYGGITGVMVLMQAASAPGALLLFAQWRLLEITAGVFAATLVAALFGTGPGGQGVASAPAPPELDRLTLAGGLLPVTILIAWQALDIPSVVQMAATTMVLLDRDVGSVHVRARQRLAGCLLGGAFGLALMVGLDLSALPLWLGVTGLGLFVLSPLHQGGGPSAYLGTQAGVAFIMALVSGQGPPAQLLPVLERLTGITLGVGLILLVAALVAPRPAAREPGLAE